MKYTSEQTKWLIDNANNYYYDTLSKMFNDKFECNQSIDAIRKKCKPFKTEKIKDKNQNIGHYMNPEYIKWIKENRPKYSSLKSLLPDFCNFTGETFTYAALKGICRRHKIRTENYKKPHQYTEEQLQWIKDNFYKYDRGSYLDQKITTDFNKKFGACVNQHCMRTLITRTLKLVKYEKNSARHAYFDNLFPIGYETTNKNGEWFVKVKDDLIPGRKNSFLLTGNYRRKANIVYEQYYNCKVDDTNQYVIMLDNNFNNFSKENLMLVDRDINKSYNSKYKCSNRDFKNIQAKRIALLTLKLEKII